jgi:hypothetical protein
LGAPFGFQGDECADTSSVRTLFHVAHGVIIGLGALAVIATLLPALPSHWRYRRSLRRLRNAARGEALVHLAEQRAAAEFDESAKRPPRHPLLVVAALASVTAAAIHGAVGPEHFREALRLGLFFVFICAVQLFLAAALLRRPTRTIVIANVVVNAATVLLWVLTRTVGLPFELAEIEPFGVLDTLSSAAELVLVGCCLTWLARHAPPVAARSIRMPLARASISSLSSMAPASAHRPEGA